MKNIGMVNFLFPIRKNFRSKGFTLLELLIVIAILAILTTVVVMVLNPAEYLAQARDTKRSVDMANINKALQMYDFDNPGVLAQQSSSTVYISLPDTVSTCTTYTLPTLPAGYTYHCVTEANLRKTDGTGWIPVNFTTISGGSPLSSLPTDPTNSATNRTYYSYVQGGSWELVTPMESALYKMGGGKDLTSTDKGKYTGLYETGTSFTLMPMDYGDSSLIGYWPLDEGSGTTAYDSSGGGNNGTWYGTGTHYAAGRVGNYTGQFNGSDDRVNLGIPGVLNLAGAQTISAWYYRTVQDTVNADSIIGNWSWNANTQLRKGWVIRYYINSSSFVFAIEVTNGSNVVEYLPACSASSVTDWYHVVAVFDPSNSKVKIYLNGSLCSTQNISSGYNSMVINSANNFQIGYNPVNVGYFTGYIDDARIYNRAFTATEVSALYSATK